MSAKTDVSKELTEQVDAVKVIEAAVKRRSENEAKRAKQAAADDRAVADAVVAGAKKGVKRNKLAAAVGIGRTTFAKHYSELLDAKVKTPRTGAKR